MEKIPHRPVGNQGLIASAQGLGCMGMTAFYGDFDLDSHEEESIKTIGKALEHGINFLDTAWMYQTNRNGKQYYNEELVGKAIKRYGRDKFVIATKFGVGYDANGQMMTSGKEAFIRQQLAESLSRLQITCIDLYYMHRMDPNTPIEETMRVLKALVHEGKIRYVGLSECTPDELRRAHAIHPVTAIQMEWSLQSRDIETTLVPVARELGIAIVAYSPLGRGFLADLEALNNMPESDWRRTNPRFSAEHFEDNKKRVARFYALAKAKNCTPAQLALAWLHSKGSDVFPIPGTKSPKRIEENSGAFALLPLTAAEIHEIEDSVSVVGDRYGSKLEGFSYNQRLP